MKTIQKTLYTLSELKAQFPDGYRAAFEQYQSDCQSDPDCPWQEETVDSLKALYKAAGITLRDWSLGPYNRGNHVRLSFPSRHNYYGDEVSNLSGARAMAWLENNLLGPLRTPWTGKRRWEVSTYGRDYRPGRVPPCPFTGVSMDEDYLESLREDIRSGSTLKGAFSNLADVAMRLMESECEYQQSEECFLERDDGEEKYTEDGDTEN